MIWYCYKDFPGLGDRSVFYPYSSVGNTFTFDVVEDTASNLTSHVYFIETLARASLNTYLPGSPGIETKWVAQRVAVYDTVTSQRSLLSEWRMLRGYIALAWVIDRYFTPTAQ